MFKNDSATDVYQLQRLRQAQQNLDVLCRGLSRVISWYPRFGECIPQL